MCYIVYQAEGKLNDAAKQYTQLRLAGRMEDARLFLSHITGKQIDSLPSLDSVWWIYNADESIRRDYHLSQSQRDYLFDHYPYDNEARAKYLCHLLSSKMGGTWKYFYEY